MLTTLSHMVELLDSINLPCTEMEWSPATAPPLPYAVLVPQKTKNRFADGTVLQSAVPYYIEVYSRVRDIPLEKKVQAAFDSAGIGWQRYNLSVPDAPAVEAIYSVTLIED